MLGASLLAYSGAADPRRMSYVAIKPWESSQNGINLGGTTPALPGDYAVIYDIKNLLTGNGQSVDVPIGWTPFGNPLLATNQNGYQLAVQIGWKKLTAYDISNIITGSFSFVIVYRPLNTISTIQLNGTDLLFTNTTPTPSRTVSLTNYTGTFSSVSVMMNFGSNTMGTTSTVTPSVDYAYGVYGAKIKLWNNLLGTDPNPFTSNSSITITGATATYANAVITAQYIFT